MSVWNDNREGLFKVQTSRSASRPAVSRKELELLYLPSMYYISNGITSVYIVNGSDIVSFKRLLLSTLSSLIFENLVVLIS